MRFGWIPDLPDHRDHTAANSPAVRALLRSAGVADGGDSARLPASVDLRPGFSPVENQGSLGSCTANAYVGLLEYFERKAHGKHVNASRLFLYWTTRHLMKLAGDTGASLRATMKAAAYLGVPPEDEWPYVTADFEKEPTPIVFSCARAFEAAEYHRLDPPRKTSAVPLIERVKANLAGGLPSMFGFSVYSSISQAAESGCIPFPAPGDRLSGGHAVVAAGYDDARVVWNSANNSRTVGAILIRNSWGAAWGNAGYGWLPYEFISAGLARDFWSLVKAKWIDLGAFN